ncbi:MAG TPA: TonB-dependent receptor [Thermoanaerobaculia bacterium]|nr:TonB-dependent receptor [Thermoanaerobaculia bacterium]
MPRLRSLLSLVLLLITSGLFAQTTGNLAGKIADANGGPLPGVTVEVKSPALQGIRSTNSQGDGTYRLALLPPGEYEATFHLEGLAPVARKNVTVSLGKDTTLDIVMKPAAVSAEIVVTANAPVLDTTSTTLGTNLNTRAIETLPSGRNYASIVQVAPGVSSDANPGNASQSTISVYGSSGAENSFFIDGVNTTNVEYGFQGKELNFEFISEVDVKTGGYEAEYGRSTGGIVNVITKSGGNSYTGDVFSYYDSDSLQSSTKSVVSTAGTVKGFTRKDYGVDVGGYVMKDKLWFFGAFDRVDNSIDNTLPPGALRAGEVVTSKSRRNLGSAKLTYNLTSGQSLVGTFLQDPRVDTGAINDNNHTLNGDPSTYLGRQDFGGRDYALRYEGAFTSNWVFGAQAARHRESNSVGPATAAGDAIQYRDAGNDFAQTGGFGLIQDKSFDRKHYAGSATHLIGSFELKGGLEFETEKAQVVKRMSGGQQVDVIANTANPAKKIYRHFYWTTPDATVANAPVSALIASPEHKITTAYIQSREQLPWNVVMNFGIRWDRQQIIDASGTTQIDMKKDFAPRFGFVWDPNGTHHMRVFGSAGRFYEEIPMDLVIRSFSYERQPRIINYSPTSTTPDANAERDLKTPSAILGGFTEPSDPNIKNQYMTEYILGGERELAPNFSVGVKGIYRSYGRVVEDFLCSDDGTYCIGNPGQGIMKEIFTLDYSTTYPAPKPKRTFKGLQFDATRRFSNNWQWMASYLWSKLDGNYDGEYAPFTNVGADPNISAAYDYYDFFTNGKNLSKITNRGPLSNDRRNQLKFSGVYFTPFQLSVGWSAYWRSGTPLTRYGYSDAYGRYEFFLTQRGAEGRTPSNYDADVHLGYPIALGRTKVNILLDVFNLLDAQRPVLLDERWGFTESDNDLATPAPGPNNEPRYLKPLLRTPPRSTRLGVRLTF